MRVPSIAVLTLALATTVSYAGDKKKDDPSQIGNRDVGKGLNFYSFEKEIALGKQLAEEVARQAKLFNDPIVGEYVNRMGQNLVRNSDAKVPFTFRVLDDDSPNAFSFPGGFVFVNTGLIKIAAEEDELAGALAHEVAHVAARHATRQATKAQLAQGGAIAGLLLGGWGGYAAAQGMGVGVPALMMRFSRNYETEADHLGVQYMYAAGYDPNGSISIFEKLESLQRKQPGFWARLFSTHPMDADRIDKTQKDIQQILPSKAEYLVTTSEYREMRERLIRLQQRTRSEEKPGGPRLVRPAEQEEIDGRPTVRRRDLIE